MTTDLSTLACQDCIPEIATATGTSSVTGGPVLAVVVMHSDTCPWLDALGGERTAAPTPDRVLVHCRAGEV